MPSVIYEDNHLLVINKPAGWLVQGDHTGDRTLIDWGKAYLKEKYEKPGAVFLHPAHRLDRPVSGAVLMARTDKALGRLNELFRTHAVEKQYLALSLNAPRQQSGELRHFLLKDEQRNIVTAFNKSAPNAKEAVLRYEYAGTFGQRHLLRVFPLTGRPHQIRVQLASMGCSIIGDVKYGASEPLADASIALHCFFMRFVHPVRQEPMEVTADFPAVPVWKDIV